MSYLTTYFQEHYFSFFLNGAQEFNSMKMMLS